MPERGEKRRLAELAGQNARLALASDAARRRAEAAAPRRGARGAARGAQPREPAAPDRVLRHLEHPGPGDRRLDGRLPGRDRRRRRTTASSACAGSTARTTSPRWRRSSRAASRGCARAREDDYDEGFAAAPNLVVIDGGKGQLSAALAAMQAYDLPRVAVIALAKRIEEVFVPRQADPILLDPHSAGLQLLQRIRDEAHRFALGFHRQRRRRGRAGRSSTSSRASGRRGGARCCGTSARPRACRGDRRRSSRACRACRRRRRARSTRSCTGPAAPG